MMTTDVHHQCRQENARLTNECVMLAEALHSVVSTSDDPDSVRVGISALQGTKVGRDYLHANPIGR